MAKFAPGQSGNPAGKKPGTLSRRTQQALDIMTSKGVDPVAALCDLFLTLGKTARDRSDRIEICRLLLPYAYPKLSTLSIGSEADRAELEAEIERELARLVALEQPH